MTGLPLLAFWVHTPHPFLIQFTENIGIRYYGLAYLLGFVVAAWLFRRYYRAGRTPLDPTASADLMVAIVLGVIVGGRLGFFLLYQPAELLNPPWSFFLFWKGGMASHGGFAGVCIALAWFAHSRKISFLHLGDLVVSIAPAGLLFGRLANFLNGELWGKVSEMPVAWAVVFEKTGGGISPRHPSQLYEAALEGALLLAYLQWRFWRTDAATRQPGRIAGEFLVGYALVRGLCEQFREPDASLILGISRGTFYSLFMIAAGVFLILRRPKAAALR